jgi:hypothetical protein
MTWPRGRIIPPPVGHAWEPFRRHLIVDTRITSTVKATAYMTAPSAAKLTQDDLFGPRCPVIVRDCRAALIVPVAPDALLRTSCAASVPTSFLPALKQI